MAVAITADVQDAWPPRVLVSVTGVTIGDEVNIYRVVAGEASPVRGALFVQAEDTSVLRVDAELPFGVPVRYRAEVDGDDYETDPATYTLPGGKVAVTDAINGTAAEVVVLSWPEKVRERDSTVFNVAGRNVVVSGPGAQFTSTIELFTETTSAGDNLRAVLAAATAGIVQVRQPGGYDGVDAYLAVLSVRERRWSQDGTDQRRIHALDVAEVDGWAPVLEARGFTLQDVADAYDGLTLDDLADDFASLLALAQGDFSP